MTSHVMEQSLLRALSKKVSVALKDGRAVEVFDLLDSRFVVVGFNATEPEDIDDETTVLEVHLVEVAEDKAGDIACKRKRYVRTGLEVKAVDESALNESDDDDEEKDDDEDLFVVERPPGDATTDADVVALNRLQRRARLQALQEAIDAFAGVPTSEMTQALLDAAAATLEELTALQPHGQLAVLYPDWERSAQTTVELTIELTAEERHQAAKDLVEAMDDLRQHELAASSIKAELAAKGKEIGARIDVLRRRVETGRDVRIVPVVTLLHFDSGLARVVRQDTCQVVSERPMRGEERQALLWTNA